MPDPVPPVTATPTGAPVPAARKQKPGAALEASLPEWQQWVNSFAENWIFAFIVAMAIRHVFLEAFQIPSASMEPMLYGDAAFKNRDFVVVDKFLSRFREPRRWDVTVFQFPLPELQGTGSQETRTAYDGDRRTDSHFINPLMYRNFVKRAVILPGDTFYIAGGDIFLRQTDGTFAIARRPPEVLEAMLDTIYRHGDQPGYLPWAATAGSAIAAPGATLDLTLAAGGKVEFTQPFRNVYLKPAKARVQFRNDPSAPLIVTETDVSMTRPQFPYEYNGKKLTGNLWDLADWNIWRLTTADLDNASGNNPAQLNDKMSEYTGDIRFNAVLERLGGSATLRLSEGEVNVTELRIDERGWKLMSVANGQETVADSGTDTLVGKAFSLSNIDDEVVLTIAGAARPPVPVKAVDPSADATRLRLEWIGAGSLVLGTVSIQRDVHYCANGFLTTRQRDASWDERLSPKVRAAMRFGKAYEELEPKEQRAIDKGEPWGYSPATVITAPPGAYLLLGDNSPHSWDSRNWGWVPRLNLRGRGLAVVWWPQRWHVIR